MQQAGRRKRLRKLSDSSSEDDADVEDACSTQVAAKGPAKKKSPFVLDSAKEEGNSDCSDEEEEEGDDADEIADGFIVEEEDDGTADGRASHRHLDGQQADLECREERQEARRIVEDLKSRIKQKAQASTRAPCLAEGKAAPTQSIANWWSRNATKETNVQKGAQDRATGSCPTTHCDPPCAAEASPAADHVPAKTMRQSKIWNVTGKRAANQQPSAPSVARPFQSKERQRARFQVWNTQELAAAIKIMSSCLKDDCCVLYSLDADRWEIIGIGSSKVIYTRTRLPVHGVVLATEGDRRTVFGAISMHSLRSLGTKASSAQSIVCGVFDSEVETICTHAGSGSSFTTLLLTHLQEDMREPIPDQLRIYADVFDRKHSHNYTLGRDDILDPKITREDEKYVELEFGETSLTIRCGTTATTSTHALNSSERAALQGSRRLVTLKEYYSKVATCILQSDGGTKMRFGLTPDTAILVSRVARNKSAFSFDALLAHSSEDGE